MRTREDSLIAVLLGDARPAPQMARWLRSPAGRRERAAYKRTLAALARVYGAVPRVRPVEVAYYTPMRTPIGRIFLAATDRGVVRIAFRRSEGTFRAELRRRLRGAAVEKSPQKVAEIAAQLEAYFAGKRTRFDVPVDLSRTTPFQRRVLAATRRVPAGRVASYGEIARRIGQPRASRAVGQALGRNPVPIVIPCHRILAGGGDLGGYTGGLAIKKKLLEIEGVGLRRSA